MQDESEIEVETEVGAQAESFDPEGPPPTTTPTPLPVEPVAAEERFAAVDVLRGFALLGILFMNVMDYAWPIAVYMNPTAGGGFEGLDRVQWYIAHFFFETKMMTIFSMLFGGGLVLMSDRSAKRTGEAGFRRVYYRRVRWLLAIGLIHAYLLWDGDVLVSYAVTGMLLYYFREKSPRTLLALGILALLVSSLASSAFGTFFGSARDASAKYDAEVAAGKTPSKEVKELRDAWIGIREQFQPKPEELQKQIDIRRGGYLGILKHRVPEVIGMHLMFLPTFLIWAAGGRMLIGMGLMKLGVLSGACSAAFYRNLAIVGYVVGLPIVAVGAARLIAHDFSIVEGFQVDNHFNWLGGVVVALGHVGLVLWIYKTGRLARLTARLAAVGQMALTNYLSHTLICITLFEGWGFGYFGAINRSGLMLVVLAIWVFQLIVSPLWLARFRFGPAEWAWRSLTYGAPQPMRRVSAAA